MSKQAKTVLKVIYNEAEKGRFDEKTHQEDDRKILENLLSLLKQSQKKTK